MMLWMAQQTLLLTLVSAGLLICHKPLQIDNCGLRQSKSAVDFVNSNQHKS